MCAKGGEKRDHAVRIYAYFWSRRSGRKYINQPGGGGEHCVSKKKTGSKKTAGKMVKMANEKSGCLGAGIGDGTFARTPMPRDHFARCHFFSTDHPSPITTTALVRASVSCKFGLTTYVMVQSKHQK